MLRCSTKAEKLLMAKTGKVQKRKRMSKTASVMSRAEMCDFIVRWHKMATLMQLAATPTSATTDRPIPSVANEYVVSSADHSCHFKGEISQG